MEGLNMAGSNPWVLAIEALLHMHQLDLSIILELIKSVPDVADELGRNARELLAVRVLEDLYAREIRNKNSSVRPSKPQTKMDVSGFCQELVDFILQGEPRGNLRFSEACILEFDVPCFVAKKRSGIQNCSLHQLKYGILEGSNPILKQLKHVSGLKVPDESCGIPIDGDVFNGITDKHGVSKNIEVKRKLASITAEDDKISEENLPIKKLSPAKRVRNIAAARNCEVASCEPCRTFEESRKKLKRVLSCFPKKPCQLLASACQHEQLGDSSSRTVAHIEEPVVWKKGPEVFSLEESNGKEDHCADPSPRLKENNDIDPGVVFQIQRLVLYADSASEGMAGKDNAQVNFSDKASGGHVCAFEPPAVPVNVSGENIEENGSGEANDFISHSSQNNVDHAMSKDNDVHGDHLEISGDSDEYHDLRTDVAMKKDSFLSSQGLDTQDSLGNQQDSCMKCNKSGSLLSCSSSSCRLTVHEECLGSAFGFDRMGIFYCPFCAYSQAISRYHEAKKKFCLARSDLVTYYVFRADLEEKSSSKRSHGSKKHGSSEVQKYI